jgi:hypothetical protein
MTNGFDKPLSIDPIKKYLGQCVTEMGILNNAPNYPDGTDIKMVANLNEYGGDNDMPPARYWLFKSGRSVEKFYRDGIKKVLRVEDSKRLPLLNELARQTVDKLRGNVENNKIGLSANAASTQSKKGGNSPMVDTKHLIRSLDYRVTRQ